MIRRIGILEGEDNSTEELLNEENTEETFVEENTLPIEEVEPIVEEEHTVAVSDHSTTTTDLHSSNAAVQDLLTLQKGLVTIYKQANTIYTPAHQKAGEDLIVFTVTEHDQVYAFINQYENFSWKFAAGAATAQQEFEQLTNNWATSTKELFEKIQENITRIKITEEHSNRLANPKPTVNHNVVDQITGEDPKLGAVYQKTDRFVKNEEGRQYVKQSIKEEDLFKVGSDDQDSCLLYTSPSPRDRG